MEKEKVLASFVEAYAEKRGMILADYADGRVVRCKGLALMQAIEPDANPGVHVFALHTDGEKPGIPAFCKALAGLCTQLAARFGLSKGEALFDCYSALGAAYHVVSVESVGESAVTIRLETVGGFSGEEE